MANRFGRSVGGNWSAAGTWSASSGGASDGAGINAGDDVILDANSSAGTFTIDTTISINSLVCTGTTATLVHNSVTLTISGNTFTLASGMTYSPNSGKVIAFTTSGTVLITCATKTLGAPSFTGTGTYRLVDNFAWNAAGVLTLTTGTLDTATNSKTLTGGNFSSNGAGTRTLTLGSGTHTLNATAGTVWDTSSTLTMTANTATIAVSANADGLRAFATGGLNLNGTTVSIATSGTIPCAVAFTGAGRILALAVTPPMRVTFQNGTTFTIDNAFTWTGTANNNAIFVSTPDSSGAVSTVSIASGAATMAWAVVQGMTFTGGATFTASNSIDLKGNTGITITGPSGGGSVGVIGS